MRLIFAGTPAFAQRALAALADAGHEIALVLSRPDKPAGRGQQLQASPVKQLALARGFPVAQPRTLRDPQVQAELGRVGADAMVVAAYGLILPREVRGRPGVGCVNRHGWLRRGGGGEARIQRAIEAGDATTGITIMQMDEGLDTGAMLLARALPIGPRESGGSVHDRLAELGAELVVEALRGLAGGTLVARAQPADGATYAAKIEKAEMQLDWRASAARLADRIRAFDPFPGTSTRKAGGGEALKVWRALALAERPAGAVPGEVLRADAGALVVACGEGALSLEELQKAGGRRLPVADFLRGFAVAAGERFETSPGAGGAGAAG